MAKNDFQYCGWNYYTLQCGTTMTLISPGDCTLQPGMWLWNHDSEFTKWQHPAVWYVALGWHAIELARWQHPAMWHIALGLWHWIRHVAAPCNVAGDMPWNSPKRLSYWNSTSGFDFDYITAVDMSLCTNLRNFIQIGPPSAQKMTSCRFSRWRISAILGFRGPIMGSLKSPCTTSYRSSIDTVALNYLVFFLENRVFAIWRQTDKQTNRRTDAHARCMKPLSLSRAAA